MLRKKKCSRIDWSEYNKFGFDYKTSADNKTIIHLDSKNKTNILVINALLNKTSKRLDKLFKTISIVIPFTFRGKKNKTTIRGDQLRMFLPYSSLLESDKETDHPFLKNFTKNTFQSTRRVYKAIFVGTSKRTR